METQRRWAIGAAVVGALLGGSCSQTILGIDPSPPGGEAEQAVRSGQAQAPSIHRVSGVERQANGDRGGR